MKFNAAERGHLLAAFAAMPRTHLLVAAFLLSACATVPKPPAEPSAYVVQPQEIARTLNLTVDQPLVLRLQANPSTGYAWKLTTEPQLLRIEGKPSFEQNAAPANSAGVPGHEVWHFRATKRGTEMLRFEYRRAWETAEAPAQIVTYHVNIH